MSFRERCPSNGGVFREQCLRLGDPGCKQMPVVNALSTRFNREILVFIFEPQCLAHHGQELAGACALTGNSAITAWKGGVSVQIKNQNVAEWRVINGPNSGPESSILNRKFGGGGEI